MIKRLKLETLDSIELFRTDLTKHEYPKHYHETFCVSLIERGTFCENDLLAISGAILICHPNEVHENKALNDNEYAYSTFYISPDIFKSISKSKHSSFDSQVIYDDTLFADFKKLSDKTFKGVNLENIEKELFANIASLTNKYGTKTPFSVDEPNLLIESAKEYILKNLDVKISLDELANKFGMNKFKFIRWFKKNLGLTPFDYIILNRVENGKEMLNQGKSILDTALDTGFYDQSHFTNYFKRFVGITPKTYQASCNIFQYSY